MLTVLQQGNRLTHFIVVACISAILLACDGGSSSSRGLQMLSVNDGWEEGVFQPSRNYASRCRIPRALDERPGSTLDERNFLRSWSHETYLWYDEIRDRNPADYDTIEYFELLKTTASTASGRPKDNFHHHMPTDEWNSLAQSGQSVGYGITWAMISSSPPRELRVAYVEPGSPADHAGIERGDGVVSVDGVDLERGTNVTVLNDGIWPSDEGETHEFVFVARDDNARKNVRLTADTITSHPVLRVQRLPSNIGYILFNDHIATAEAALVDAINDLQGVDELVLDIRYNGGGYLAIASQLAYMIAGPGPTRDQTFELTRFNDKHPTRNPVTGERLRPIPFLDETQGFSLTAGQSLPNLGLSRVFVLTGSGTCSASEAIINGLRGVDVEVIQIGTTTCGKPYGYYPQNNCGITYFTIQFQGVNAKGFGDYPDGFSPSDELGVAEPQLPGCAVNDDFSRELGDPREKRLASALAYIDSNGASCGLSSSVSLMRSKTPVPAHASVEAQVIKPAALQGRILDR